MGQAKIISDLGAGQYTVQRQYSAIDGQIALLAARRKSLEAYLPKLRNKVAQAMDEAQAYKSTVRAMINLYLKELWQQSNPDKPDPYPYPDPPPAPNPDPPVPPINDGPSDADKREVLRLVNEIRAANDLPPLTWNDQLADAANQFAEERALYNHMSHTGADGSQPADRIADAGYEYTHCGENVAAGQKTPQEVVDDWMRSPNHRANILNPNYTELGVGGGKGNIGNYWVQNFGTPKP